MRLENGQETASDTNLFFQRVNQTHALRFAATIDLLRKGDKVVSTGLSGVGKSTELNAYLMVFLSNIGKEGWPKEVWYRYEFKMLIFSLVNG